MKFIDINAHYLAYKKEIDEAIATVFNHGQFIMGPEVEQLEKALAEFVGVKECITTSSGTVSLEIALRALGIGYGDEVITVPFTFVSTAEVIELVGAKTVFVDIDPESFSMNMSHLYDAITSRTKAIIPVSLFGQMADLETANQIAEKYELAVIEDGAQSFGATLNGRKSGSVTTIGSTSFFPTKPFGCFGEGGALFTNDVTLSQKMRRIRNHGSEKRDEYLEIGMNARLHTIQAAILLAKLPHFNDEIKRRQHIAKTYDKGLIHKVNIPKIERGKSHVYSQYTLRVSDREKFRNDLKYKGIPTSIYYSKCIYEQPAFGHYEYENDAFPESKKAADEVVSLPFHIFLSKADQEFVISEVCKSLGSM